MNRSKSRKDAAVSELLALFSGSFGIKRRNQIVREVIVWV